MHARTSLLLVVLCWACSEEAATTGRRVSALADADRVGDAVSVVDHGHPDDKLDLLFVPEGYTQDELDDFRDDVDESVEILSLSPSFARYWDRINVWRVDVASPDSGVEDMESGPELETAFEAGRWGENDTNPGTGQEGLDVADELARRIPAEAWVMIINDPGWGGNGLVTLTRGNLPALPHELAHNLGGLADEYDDQDWDCGDLEYPIVGPNVVLSSDRNSLPWAHLIENDTPLPTPENLDYDGVVGAFEGGARCERGAYRPTLSGCLMRDGHDFCPVCREVMDGVFEEYGGPLPEDPPEGDDDVGDDGAGGDDDGADDGDDPGADGEPGDEGDREPERGADGDSCPAEWRADGVCDRCLGDDPDCFDSGECSPEWRGDGVCDRCLGDDPDCTPPRPLPPACSLAAGATQSSWVEPFVLLGLFLVTRRRRAGAL